MKTKKLVAGVAAIAVLSSALIFAGCEKEKTAEAPHTATEISAVKSCEMYVYGYEWGPAVPKIVIGFNKDVSGADNDTFEVKTTSPGWGSVTKTKRIVLKVYNCDENGKEVASSSYLAIEMSVDYGEASPFTYSMTTGKNDWASSYGVILKVKDGKSFKVGDSTYLDGDSFTYEFSPSDRKVPQTQSWVKDTVTYVGEGKDITLTRASWAPEGAIDDGVKNPLIIWLHGAGEGGTDIDIDLLGNEVTALTSENEVNIQGYFNSSGSSGAYVLAVQTPTIWMDEDGTGKYNHQDETRTDAQESYYTKALWQAITSYVDSNDDIDLSRIYLGGCSNGGYMTMNMMFNYGDYFAAFYPICEAYLDQRISDEYIEKIKDYNIWFIQSADDNTVTPSKYSIPTFSRLVAAGAENVHMTLTEHVVGKEASNPETAYLSQGHWSWIYAFNDDVKYEFDNSLITDVSYITPENCTKQADMWQWLSMQVKK